MLKDHLLDCFLVLTLLIPCVGLAQSDSLQAAEPAASLSRTIDSTFTNAPDERGLQWYDMFTNIPRDWLHWGQNTFRSDNVPLFIGLTASTAALLATDQPLWDASDAWYKGSHSIEKASDLCELIGDGKTQFGLAAVFGVYGFAARDARALRTASQTVEMILACGTVVQVLKHLTGRESPLVSTASAGRWRFFPNQIEYHQHVPYYDAYPSGHIATALGTVTVVAENYPEITWIRPVGYTLVGLLAISMANTGIHWYSDYPLGLALGYSFGMLIAHPEENKAQDPNDISLTFVPTINKDNQGVRIVLSF